MDEVQDIETLKSRYESMREQKTRAETLLGQAQAELERLRAEAQERFGTDDLDQLRAKLAAMEAENLKKRKDYQGLLDGIERDLRSVEEQIESA
jgi:uncharacterized Fe-S cluster-containing protein